MKKSDCTVENIQLRGRLFYSFGFLWTKMAAGASRGAAVVLFCYRFTKLFPRMQPSIYKKTICWSILWKMTNWSCAWLFFFFSSLVCIWELHDSKANWVLTMGQSDHKIFIMDSIGLFVPSWFSCIGWLELQKKPLLNFKNYCFVLYYSLYARNATLWAWILPRWPACKQDNPFLGSVEGLQNRNKQTPDGSPFHFIINLVVIYSYLTAQSKTLNIKRWLNRKRLNKKIHDSHEGC